MYSDPSTPQQMADSTEAAAVPPMASGSLHSDRQHLPDSDSQPTAAAHAGLDSGPPSLFAGAAAPFAAAWVPAAELAAGPMAWCTSQDGIADWGTELVECPDSGLPLSVPLPAAAEGGRPSPHDCSWGSCSPAGDGSLSPAVSPANSGAGPSGAAAGAHEVVAFPGLCLFLQTAG